MERLVCLIIGYGFGLFQTAYFYGKYKGIDIRKFGSGNAGTTNAMRVLGKKAGYLVFLGDTLKCVFAIITARLLYGETFPDMIYLLALYAAAGAILGHNYPVYLQFRGGKGIAATAGIIVCFHPLFIPIVGPVFFITLFATKYVSLGSLLVYTSFMIELVVLGQLGFFHMSQAHLLELYALGGALTIMAFVKHRANIGRLIKGTESKTYLFKKKEEK